MNKIKFPKQIASEADVEQFYQHCVQVVGVGFHCDTPFRDYLEYSTTIGMSTPMFEDIVAEQYENFNLQCFGFCAANNLNIKSVCMKALSDVIDTLKLEFVTKDTDEIF